MAGLLGSLYNLFGERGVTDEPGTTTAPDDFGYGAAHVDVDTIELHFIGDFADDLSVIFGSITPDLGDDFDVFLFQKLAFFVGYTKPMNDALAGFLMYEPVGRNKFGHDDMQGGWIGNR